MQDWAGGPSASAELESGDQITLFYQAGENRPDEDFGGRNGEPGSESPDRFGHRVFPGSCGDSLDEEFSTNLRVSFIHRPGSDLFVVFTEEGGSDGDLWKFSERASVMKLTYLRRF